MWFPASIIDGYKKAGISVYENVITIIRIDQKYQEHICYIFQRCVSTIKILDYIYPLKKFQ
jgi:hypothetical protein